MVVVMVRQDALSLFSLSLSALRGRLSVVMALLVLVIVSSTEATSHGDGSCVVLWLLPLASVSCVTTP